MKIWSGSILFVGWLFCAGVASGYMVGSAENLEKLAGKADLIFKATVVNSAQVQDEWFKPIPGFAAFETRLTLISVIKGPADMKAIRFRHYDKSPQPPEGLHVYVYAPQYYHLQENESYLVFASATGEPGVCRQLWSSHTAKEDLGVLRCFDKQPTASGTLKEIFWAELMALLRSQSAKDPIYAIQQLDQMSGLPDRLDSTTDFDRTDVLKAIGPLIIRENDEIARAAITVVGSGNPYLTEERAQYWLATVGSAQVQGISKMDPKMRNPGGELYWKELGSIADGKMPVATRALAIRALGLVRNAALREPLNRWLKDPEPIVRAAAVVLLADFPGKDAQKHLVELAADPAPEVRRSVAHAIGFMQQAEWVGQLSGLLADKDAGVRRAASLSLLSFSPKSKAVAEVFVANLENEEFSPLFINALAIESPGAYLEQLAQVVERKTAPRNWPGGQIPAFTAFNILFKYLQSQPADAVREGKFDRYLDAIEKGFVTGSSEPRDIYAFYLQRGMTQRAKAYRAAAKQAASYDLDYYFNMVDQNPSTYTR